MDEPKEQAEGMLPDQPDNAAALPEAASKQVLPTGEVARVCRVSPRTVGKWLDSGRLAGRRVPGNQTWRVPRESLVRFLKEHNMPLGELEGGAGEAKELTPLEKARRAVAGLTAEERRLLLRELHEAEGGEG